jgi:hypothetical protein
MRKGCATAGVGPESAEVEMRSGRNTSFEIGIEGLYRRHRSGQDLEELGDG